MVFESTGKSIMATTSEALIVAEQCRQMGRWSEAEQIYRQIVEADPGHAEAWVYLGMTQSAMGRFTDAMGSFSRALHLRPNWAEAHQNLGLVRLRLGLHEEAITSFRESLRLDPGLVQTYNNLGLALKQQGRFEEAESHYREAIRRKPDCAEACHNLGNLLADLGRLGEAADWYRQAIRHRPDYLAVLLSLAELLTEMGEFDEALGVCRQALQFHPASAEAYDTLGLLYCEQGRLADALAAHEQAIRLRPSLAEAHWNRALALLKGGNFVEAWPEFEWRWRLKQYQARHFRQPAWEGSPLRGRSILLYSEMGLGDTIQFIRFAPLVKQQGGTVIVQCHESLVNLLATCSGVDQVVPHGWTLPAFDVHAPLLRLPGVLGTRLDTIPANVPYLSADKHLVRLWGRQICRNDEPRTENRPIEAFSVPRSPFSNYHSAFSSLPFAQCLKVGVAWQGNPAKPKDWQRSFSLSRFEPLARMKGIRLFSLQKGLGSEQLQHVGDSLPIIDLGSRFKTFADTAAAMMNLDLIITVDSAVAHCAGALGLPVWVAIPYASDWRWLINREDSPWYPTMRLFRQRSWGDWDGVFGQITAEVRRKLEH